MSKNSDDVSEKGRAYWVECHTCGFKSVIPPEMRSKNSYYTKAVGTGTGKWELRCPKADKESSLPHYDTMIIGSDNPERNAYRYKRNSVDLDKRSHKYAYEDDRDEVLVENHYEVREKAQDKAKEVDDERQRVLDAERAQEADDAEEGDNAEESDESEEEDDE